LKHANYFFDADPAIICQIFLGGDIALAIEYLPVHVLDLRVYWRRNYHARGKDAIPDLGKFRVCLDC
jgi:hypothetical protein